MEEALRSAQRALEAGEVPVGAVVVCQGRVVGRGSNRNLTDCDPTAHAEIVALREAGRTLGNHRLGDCELFATIEPCAMCAGAAVLPASAAWYTAPTIRRRAPSIRFCRW